MIVPSNNDLQVLKTIATTAHVSGLYNTVGGEAKILMILLAAQDLNIKPTVALNGGIWNIQGKIEISARLMSSMIRKAGHSISFKQCDSKACILVGKRADNGDMMEASFTIEDAQKAGLANRDVWKKFTEDMLYARCLSRLARRLFADVIGTAYVEGEIRDCEMITVTPEIKEQAEPEIKEPEVKEIVDSNLIDLEEGRMIQAFTSQYPDEKDSDIELFFGILKDAWKKPYSYILEKYRDHELFMKDFEKWKSKRNS